ncbi:hypothetical protein SUGI_1009660 [Cryptomeria japonica]|uniref:2-oxoglutarate-dependent dioxygenase DAO-like n=1 Tax=Cryptomeria japonica TaxID=3369 RepID=UPI0024147EE8|nr:2-oxoglutarate-dependent dioxygenase DAO-like [Cryptomeria japonica]GLJ47804.1 hypothetical protein SUGI_1009660 [Cryptomeria japonica]
MYDVASEPSPDCTDSPSHIDGNNITLLQEDEAGGFQFLKGGEWMDVKPIPHSLIAVAGDGFQAWSHGRVLNVKHRVMVKKQQSRLSMTFFNVFPEVMEIKAPPELIDEEHPQLYRSFQNREFIQYMMKHAKERDDQLLMMYVGIPAPTS